MDCPFCNNRDEVIEETNNAYVILDKHPIVKGHMLVIPKKHCKSIMEIEDEVLYEIIQLIKEMEMRMVSKLGVEGITLRQNWIPFIKNNPLVVEHVHFHLIPRRLNDKLVARTERIALSNEEIDEIVSALKQKPKAKGQ